jgi:hypothetical protein
MDNLDVLVPGVLYYMNGETTTFNNLFYWQTHTTDSGHLHIVAKMDDGRTKEHVLAKGQWAALELGPYDHEEVYAGVR